MTNNFGDTVRDSEENERTYMHNDASIDQARMKDFSEDHPIVRRNPLVFLQATPEDCQAEQ